MEQSYTEPVMAIKYLDTIAAAVSVLGSQTDNGHGFGIGISIAQVSLSLRAPAMNTPFVYWSVVRAICIRVDYDELNWSVVGARSIQLMSSFVLLMLINNWSRWLKN